MIKHRYLPMTEQDENEMLAAVGVDSIDDLFSDIPEDIRFKGEYNIKQAKSEPALLKELSNLAMKNADLEKYVCFLGRVYMTIISRRLSTMSFHDQSFTLLIHLINRKFRKEGCKRFFNIKR